MNKRDRIKSNFSNIDAEVFRTDRDRRKEKKRRKHELTKFDRNESKQLLKKLNE